MTDVDKLFDEYRAAHEASGFVDPQPYLRKLEGADRDELEALLDHYLMTAPGRDWDPVAYAGSPAERAIAAIEEAAEGGLWPELLPSLSARAKLKRSEVVARLAATLGLSDQEHRVAEYYHRMEHGSLAEPGVSNRVLEALGQILGESAEALRVAGRAIAAPGKEGRERASAAFARIATTDERYSSYATSELSESLLAKEAPDQGSEPDHLDRLFTGGPDAV